MRNEDYGDSDGDGEEHNDGDDKAVWTRIGQVRLILLCLKRKGRNVTLSKTKIRDEAEDV
jgi:hypothetical protein